MIEPSVALNPCSSGRPIPGRTGLESPRSSPQSAPALRYLRFLLFSSLRAIGVATLMVACSKAPDVTGNWSWVIPGSHYSGRMTLRQSHEGSITGTMYDAGDGETGVLTGRTKGNFVEFKRVWGENYEQQYKLALSANGKKLVGTFDGFRDLSAGTDFEANRK